MGTDWFKNDIEAAFFVFFFKENMHPRAIFCKHTPIDRIDRISDMKEEKTVSEKKILLVL